ncbi:MAG: UDP-N-acetylmuramate--L-alanine ligase [Phycisphaerae bacterium]|nr:UDP-N-acetylmuramate--L-alanine ligase [Phycisphaerae bacterium]
MSTNPTTASSAARAVDADAFDGDVRGVRIHMIGIGGSGMSGLAALLLQRGATVTGSDPHPSPQIDQLVRRGIHVSAEQTEETVPPGTQLVVHSAAIPATHPELQAARQRGIATLKYSRMLGLAMRQCDGIGISGTHGKSTTTAWLAYVMTHAGFEPSFVVGAVSPQLGGGSGVGKGRYFVVEACEYDRSFLNLCPRNAAILNIEEDHLDCYAGLPAIQQAFADFAALLPDDGLLVVNGDDAACRDLLDESRLGNARIETFGLEAHNTWCASGLVSEGGLYRYDLRHDGKPLGTMHLGVAGRHNVFNSLAVVALAHAAGVQLDVIREGLREYRGVGRRLELRGEIHGVRVVDDYAHHPTEIRATLEAARERYQPRRLWCVFQPHQHSRTRFLLEDFAASFAAADRVIMPDIYFVRDSAREREAVRAEDLVERIAARGGAATHIASFDAIAARLQSEIGPGDVVITMGAGTVWQVADDLVRRLRCHLPA